MKKRDPDFISIFNDVLGPVMRGPSSSHTAGSYRIACIARDFLGEVPVEAVFTFGKGRSYAQVYKEQGVDNAFASGLMEWGITDRRFLNAKDLFVKKGRHILFKKEHLEEKHPNAVQIELKSKQGKRLKLEAKSTGGGAVHFSALNQWSVDMDGKSHVLFIECRKEEKQNILRLFDLEPWMKTDIRFKKEKALICFKSSKPFDEKSFSSLKSRSGVTGMWKGRPVFFTKMGDELFLNAGEIIDSAKKTKKSLGELAIEYESKLLGLSIEEVFEEMDRRYKVMEDSVEQGLKDENIRMNLLGPSAGKIMKKEADGSLFLGGPHLRAASRALAVMHIANSGGIVCAAPTGGSAGVLPGVAVTLKKDLKISLPVLEKALFAAAAVGLIIARRATFAAETAGCQAEIGAAGAMAAALVVECAGGSVKQAVDAACISLQNTMGSVCDLVQGMCEIPCHTRNAAAASNAFICADLIMGGYENPISLDDTVDALLSVGKMLPSELKCTAKGGLAAAPSAKSILKRK
jgi:L-serine dehydratase